MISVLHSKCTALKLTALTKCALLNNSMCADSVVRLHKKCFETGQSHQKRIYCILTWHTVTSVTSSKLYKLNKKFSRHITSVITRIERFPLVVSPIVKL